MNKCLRIIITAKFSDDLLYSFIHKSAKSLKLEGTAQVIDAQTKDPQNRKVLISVCGDTEVLDEFIDTLHKGAKGFDLKGIEVGPFLKDKIIVQYFASLNNGVLF
jgi:hypothetical protein